MQPVQWLLLSVWALLGVLQSLGNGGPGILSTLCLGVRPKQGASSLISPQRHHLRSAFVGICNPSYVHLRQGSKRRLHSMSTCVPCL